MSSLWQTEILAHACLYASFDQVPDAELSRGEGRARLNSRVALHATEGGRHGGCLVFAARDHGWAEDECVFAA